MPVKKYILKNICSNHICAIATVNEKEPVLEHRLFWVLHNF
nr:MAG TPA: hypothetical protein [Caudoviricetes sp.]